MKHTDYEKWWDDYTDTNRLDPGTKIRKEIISTYIGAPKYKRILDLGCGSGELLAYIHERFPSKKLFGTDVSKKALDILTKRKITEKTFILNLEKNTTIAETYDAIICSEVIEHLHTWRNALKAMSVAAAKGTLVIVTTQSGKRYPHHKKIGHIKHFEPEEIANELMQQGFSIITAKKFGWPFMNLKNYLITYVLKGDSSGENISWFGKLTMQIFYYLYKLTFLFSGPQILVVAKKN